MADLTADEVYRDYETNGVPASGKRKPRKSEIRRLHKRYELFIASFTSNGGLIFTLAASLPLVLNYPPATMAWVLGDPIAANNGIYQKQGASGTGSWLRISDLPFSFIIASDVGAGSPNAIQATTSIPVSGSSLIWMNIFEANTASLVTVSFNGGSALTIKTNSGSDVAAGGLSSGMIVLGVVSGNTFRLLNDQVSSAIVQAAEDAADRAEAAASLLNFVTAYGAVDLTGGASAQTVVAAAVAWSYAKNTPLFWPAGTFSTTESIPNFHNVRHSGPGVVKRESRAADIVINGDFSSSTGWSLTNATISGGTLNFSGAGAGVAVKPIAAIKPLTIYEITYTIVSMSAGNTAFRLEGATPVIGASRTSPGTYTERLTSNATTTGIRQAGSATFNGVIDNVTVREVATDLFPVQPVYASENAIYFSAAGTPENDGLSASQPKTFQTALDALKNYGPVLNGSWTLKGAAGNYSNGAGTLADLATAGLKLLKIQGPAVSLAAGALACIIINGVSGVFQVGETITGGTSGFTATVAKVTTRKLEVTILSGTPSAGETISGGTSTATAFASAAVAVPTMVMDGASAVSVGIRAYGGQRVEIKDIKFKNYTARGINANGNCLISTRNVHDEDNLYGIFVEGFGARLYVSGGVWEKSASYSPGITNARIQSFFGVKHHIGYEFDEASGQAYINTSIALAPQLICAGSSAGARGLSAAENATGHAFLRATDFFKGVEVQSSARVHLDHLSVLHRNSYGIEWRSGEDCSIEPTVDFGAGTVNENIVENVRMLSGGVDSNSSLGHAFALGMLQVASQLATITHTGTTLETQIGGTLYTLSGNHFKTTGGFRLRVYGTFNAGVAGTKALIMKVGGNSVAAVNFLAAAAGGFMAELDVVVKDNDLQVGTGWGICGVTLTSNGIADVTSTDLTQPWADGTNRNVTFHVQLGSAADSITVKAVELWRIS